MPSIRSLAFKCYTCVVTVILLLGEIMPSYSHYKEKKLVYITIVAPSSHQPFFCSKYTKSNIRLSCNVRSVSNTKYIFISLCNIYNLSQLLSGNTW